MTESLSLSPDQVRAVDRVLHWLEREPDRQTMSLAGYAGTGKTTVISHLIDRLPGRVIVAAPTGKAALRLRQKGVRATTIHQLAYRFEGEDANGDPEFTYTGIKDAGALVIIDEASMINDEIYRDLVGGGYRMLFVGDHGQLAPVGDDPGIMRSPDVVLDVIHRQDDSGLLDFAHQLRDGVYLPEASGAVSKHWLHPIDGATGLGREAMTSADVVLCYQNRTRWHLNSRIMVDLGLTSHSVATGGAQRILLGLVGKTCRVVALKNNYRVGIFNGQLADLAVQRVTDDAVYGDLTLDTGVGLAGVTVSTLGFGRKPEGAGDLPSAVLLMDFGYVLTAHKSQGSEWDHVCVYDDTFRGMRDRARWCYTAATRAKRRLTWLHR